MNIPSLSFRSAACVAGFVVLSLASVQADITAVTQTGTDTYVLGSVTINGLVYAQEDIALGQLDAVLPASSTAAIGEIRGFTPAAGDATLANINAASSSFVFGTSALNIATGSIFQFGRTITDTDTLFVLELGPSENAVQTFELVDSSDSVIGSYTFSFNIRDDMTDGLASWPNGISFRTVSGNSGNAATVTSLAGLTITLADFGVSPGEVTNATGIRFQNQPGLDAPIAGLVAVPEVESHALLLGAISLAVLALYRRRRS